MRKPILSVVLATKNEEENIGGCLQSVEKIFSKIPKKKVEILIFDEYSTDKTCEIAKKFGAKIYKYQHRKNFHETKQKAIEKAKGEWILQLDADERISPALASEIGEVVFSDNEKLLSRVLTYKNKNYRFSKFKIFFKHQEMLEKMGFGFGKKTKEVVAFMIPRLNFFLGKPLIYAGVYPDGVIRLIKKGKARLAAESVHEIMQVDGKVGWLFNDLEHYDSPTFSRYLKRMDRYTDLESEELHEKKVRISFLNFFKYSFLIPFFVFSKLFFRHKGFMDGFRGFVWSLFSALHFPISFFKYFQNLKKDS